MLDFNPFTPFSTFRTGKLNGFDVMIMESAERADKIIKYYKKEIDNYNDKIYELEISYDDTDILDIDQKRIDREIEKYCRIHNAKFPY